MSPIHPTRTPSDLSTGRAPVVPSRSPPEGPADAERARPSLRRQALGLVAVYLIAAGSWIVVSDGLLGALVRDPEVLTRVSLYKGFAFVAASAALLHVVLRRHVAAVEASLAAVERKEAERAHHEIERRRTEAIVESTGDAVISCDLRGTSTGWNPAATQLLGAQAVATREQGFARDLVEAMPGVFYLYDRDGRFLRWNRNLERVSGYSSAEIATLEPEDLFASEDHARLQRRIEDVFVHGESQLEAALVAKDGGRTPYCFTGRRIEFQGESCLVGVGVDIGERVRAEVALGKSEERYRTTLDTILEGCQLLDFDWRYLYLNDAAALQNRRPNAELLGTRMSEAWPGVEDTPLFGLLERGMRARVAVHGEIEFVFTDGAKGWFDVRAQPVPEGLFVLSIDISERKQAEQALHELNLGLERIVAERTADLEAARERAEAADRVKSAFLATMSHELRTPLNSILGFTGIIRQGLAGPVTDEQSKQLGMVQSSGRHLLDLINDVLDISKIEAGQLEVRIAPFDLGASIARVVASVQPMAQKKGLTVHVAAAELPPMHSDRRRVEQILLNLLNNALKFTDTGEVTLTITRTASGVAMRVADTGIGIRAEDLALLFVPFRQIDTGLQRRHEGTGLGLAICRRLTALLGGTITAESRVGQGSAFTVELPRTPDVTT